MTPEKYLKTHCTVCDGHIEFPYDALGAEIACPHCGGKTVLSELPSSAKTIAAPKEQPSKPSAVSNPTGKSLAQLAVIVGVVVLILGAGGFLAYRAFSKKAGDSSNQSGSATTSPNPSAEPGNSSKTPAADAPPVEPVAREKTAQSGKKKEGLEVAKFEIQKAAKGNVVYVVGRVINHDPAQYFKLKVEFNLFKKGTAAGQCSDRLANLAPNGSWDFKALILEDGVDEAKLATIEGEKE